MLVVPDQGAGEEFAVAALNPPFHDRVHLRDADTGEDDLDARVSENGLEQLHFYSS